MLSLHAGSWIPKAFSRPQSDTGAGSAGPGTALQSRTRFADEPLLTGQLGQPSSGQDTPLAPVPLPSSKAPMETFTALPSLPVPAPITGQYPATNTLPGNIRHVCSCCL